MNQISDSLAAKMHCQGYMAWDAYRNLPEKQLNKAFYIEVSMSYTAFILPPPLLAKPK